MATVAVTIKRVTKRLWFRATLYCVVGIVTALIGVVVGPWLPPEFTRKLGADAVGSILTILASSMLAVTTFSLSTLVSAASAAASGATPRATGLLLEDKTAQTALSTFLGSFLFSLVGIIALNTRLYGEGGRLVLFVVTLGVVTLIVTTLLRWIDHLGRMGRLGETIHRVSQNCEQTMKAYARDPLLGGQAFTAVPSGAIAIYHQQTGYIQGLNMASLSAVASASDADIYVALRPGAFCEPTRPIAYLVFHDTGATLKDGITERMCQAFDVGEERLFDEDPRFGLIVMCEIGSRALSAAINDSGTAIRVVSNMVSLLQPLACTEPTPAKVLPGVFIRPIEVQDFFEDAFLPLIRDGAGLLEVGIRLQKTFRALASSTNRDVAQAAVSFARSSLSRGQAALAFEDDRQRLQREADWINSLART